MANFAGEHGVCGLSGVVGSCAANERSNHRLHPTNHRHFSPMPLENPQRYTVTAALIYANGPIHIGHLAGCYLPADIYVRYLRGTGKDVAFISGTDEHGVPITIKAKKEGSTPQQVVDK